MTTEPTTSLEPFDFASWVTQQAKGQTNRDLSDGMHTVLKAIAETGKKGRVRLTLDITPTGDDGPVAITDKIELTVPEHNRPTSLWYVDEGRLVRNDPHQPDLFRS